ncbi:MAG: hypothetical protein LBG04_03940 [Holosporaceae bacterium]|jgi:hypothetical protein|nr:hypothetical protein [Holosporaceae bacterium]
MNNFPTYFFEKDFLNYIHNRFGYENFSYINREHDYTFYAPILIKNGKVEACSLSFLPVPFMHGNPSKNAIKKEMKNYFSKLNEIGAKYISLRQDPLLQYDNRIIKFLLLKGFSPNVFYTTIVNLQLTIEELWKNLRDRYRSLINSLEKDKTLIFVKVNSLNIDQYFIDWKELYSKLLARGSSNSNDLQFVSLYDSIKNGFSNLYLLYKENTLISGIHIVTANNKSYFFAGGTAPEYEGDSCYSHFLFWKIIPDLKKNKVEFLEIGPIFFDNVKNFYNHSEKETTISFFKLGIGGEITHFFVYQLSSDIE